MQCFSVWLFLISLKIGQASNCDGSEHACTDAPMSDSRVLMHRGAVQEGAVLTGGKQSALVRGQRVAPKNIDEASMQRKKMKKSVVLLGNNQSTSARRQRVAPKSCQVYQDKMELEDEQLWSGSKKLYDAAAVTGTRVALKFATSMASFAGASVGLGFGLSMLGGVLFPDPNQERLENLEMATDCLFDSVALLEQDVEKLKEDMQHHAYLSQLDTTLPLKTMAQHLKHQGQAHRQCAMLMKCAADYQWKNNWKKDTNDDCHQHLYDTEGIVATQESCNAAGFAEKFESAGDYKFLTESYAHLQTHIDYTIRNNVTDMYVFAHSILNELTNLVTEMYYTLATVMEWAGAICAPYKWYEKKKNAKNKKKHSACYGNKEVKNVKAGLRGFKNYKKKFLEAAKEFLGNVEESSFKEQRKMSEVPGLVSPAYSSREGGDACGSVIIGYHDMSYKPGFSFCGVTLRRKEYGFSCPDKDATDFPLKEPCEGHSECQVVIHDDPIKCNEEPCKPFLHFYGCYDFCKETKCEMKSNCYCMACGCTDPGSTDIQYSLIFDHLKQSVDPLKEAIELLDNGDIDEPPYMLEKGTDYIVVYKDI